MGKQLGAAALGIGTSIADQIGNQIFGEMNQRRELRGQKKALEQQNAAQLDMWNKTNYGAQIEHMKAAGLNPGLIYGMKGGGGVTTGSGSATAEGRPGSMNTGMAMQSAAQLGLMQANIKALEAKAEKDSADAAKTKGVDTDLAVSQIDLLKKQATTEEQKAIIAQWEGEIKKWDAHIKMNSWEDSVTMIQRELERLENEVDKGTKDKAIRNGYWDEYVSAARADMASKILQNEAMKAGIALTSAQINKIGQDIQTAWFNAWTGRYSHRLNVGSKEWEMLMKDVKDSTKLSVETIKGILQPLIFGGMK